MVPRQCCVTVGFVDCKRSTGAIKVIHLRSVALNRSKFGSEAASSVISWKVRVSKMAAGGPGLLLIGVVEPATRAKEESSLVYFTILEGA